MKAFNAVVVLTILNLLALLIGFATNLVISALFGVSAAMDAYVLASSIHLYITGIISGSTSLSFLPALERVASDQDSLNKFFTRAFWASVSAGVSIAGLLMIISPSVISMVSSSFDPGLAGEATKMLQVLLPSAALSVVNELISSVYVLRKNYIRPAVIKALTPLIQVAALAIFYGQLSPLLLAYATLAASLIQTVVFLMGFRKRLKIELGRPTFVIDHAIRDLFRQTISLATGMAVYRSLPVFDKFLVAGVGQGWVSSLAYSDKIVSFLSSITLGGVSVVVLQRLTADYVAGRREEFANQVHTLLQIITFITVPIVTIFFYYPAELVKLVFQRGLFGVDATIQVSTCLKYLIFALLPANLGSVLAQCFYAAQKNNLVAIIGIIEAALFVIIAIPLTNLFGIDGFLAAKLVFWGTSLLFHIFFLRQVVSWRALELARFCFWVLGSMFIAILAGKITRIISAHSISSVAVILVSYYFLLKLTPAWPRVSVLEQKLLEFFRRYVSIRRG